MKDGFQTMRQAPRLCTTKSPKTFTRTAPPFGQDVERSDLILYIRQLEAELAAMTEKQAVLEALFSHLRSCHDPRCVRCPECVMKLFVRAEPAPMTLPQQYVSRPWRT